MPFRKIKLYGKLGKLFGKEWNLDVNSVGEAIRAINANTNGRLEEYLYNGKGAKVYYKVCIKNKNNTISKEEINIPYQNGDIYIIPTIKGSGKGVFQTILGVVLIVVGYFTGTMGILGRAGIALALGGVAQMLAPNPKVEDTERKTSYLFQGNANTINQGAPVGTVYGRALVAPMPISISADNIDQNSYEGEILQIGKLGILQDTELLYSYKGGYATLVGHSEFIDPSTPPKKYRLKKYSGASTQNLWNVYPSYPDHPDYYDCGESTLLCVTTYELRGQCEYDIYTGKATNSLENVLIRTGSGCGGEGEFHSSNFCEDLLPGVSPGPGTLHTTQISQWYELNGDICVLSDPVLTGAVTTGEIRVDIYNEDTELDAINRLLLTSSWSAWQSTPIYPYYEQRISGFGFHYRTVKTKTITTEKYNPGINYKLSYTIQRRTYGSSDPFIDAETIQTQQKPNNSGDFEIDIENQSGYESKITNLTISL